MVLLEGRKMTGNLLSVKDVWNCDVCYSCTPYTRFVYLLYMVIVHYVHSRVGSVVRSTVERRFKFQHSQLTRAIFPSQTKQY